MTNLHGVIGDVPELVFISDRCTSIQKVVYRVFFSALHKPCFYHFQGNVKSHFMILVNFGSIFLSKHFKK